MFPGASPERVEQLVTDPVERVVQSIPELDFVGSTSRTGVSIVLVRVKEKRKTCGQFGIRCAARSRSSLILPEGVIGPNVNDELGETF